MAGSNGANGSSPVVLQLMAPPVEGPDVESLIREHKKILSARAAISKEVRKTVDKLRTKYPEHKQELADILEGVRQDIMSVRQKKRGGDQDGEQG